MFRQRMESIRRTWQTRSTLEKGLLIAVMALALLSLGLIIGLAASASGVKDTRDKKTRGLLKIDQ